MASNTHCPLAYKEWKPILNEESSDAFSKVPRSWRGLIEDIVKGRGGMFIDTHWIIREDISVMLLNFIYRWREAGWPSWKV